MNRRDAAFASDVHTSRARVEVLSMCASMDSPQSLKALAESTKNYRLFFSKSPGQSSDLHEKSRTSVATLHTCM